MLASFLSHLLTHTLALTLTHSLCGRAPLVLVPNTNKCMGVESFPEESRCPLHVGTDASLWWT